MRLTRLCCVLLAAGSLSATVHAADWLQFGYDQSHSGNNNAETILTPANVSQLTSLFTITLPGNVTVDSAPVFVSGVTTATGVRDLLFVHARTGILFGLDAVSGAVIWQQQPATAAASKITQSSPMIDPDRQFVYAYGVEGRVHKYQVGDGVEITGNGWPQVVTLKPLVEKGASALSFGLTPSGRKLYAVSSGYVGDAGDYQGHITTIDLDSGTQNVFNVHCSSQTIHLPSNGCAGVQSGVWGRPGAIYDAATNRVYFSTGNGIFNSAAGNFGDTVLALSANGTGNGAGMPLDSYTPTTHAALNSSDQDLGSSSPVLLAAPVGSLYPHLAVQGGKDSKLHLLNLDNMSGAGIPGREGGALSIPSVPQGGAVLAQPATWVDASGRTWLFVATSGGIAGMELVVDVGGTPSLVSRWTKTGSSTSVVIANGMLFHYSGSNLIARNPSDGAVLWTSPALSGKHWQSPIVVNGRVYLAIGSSSNTGGSIVAFALNPIFVNGFDLPPVTIDP